MSPTSSPSPEVILTVTGVIVMMAEPMIAPGKTRKPLGWLAIAGTVSAIIAGFHQHHFVNAHGTLMGFYNTIQLDQFSVFFHLLIASVVLAVLLGSLDYFEGPTSHAGEYFALVCFGAVGMMLMSCSVELLMVFVGLEISSISTYISLASRKGQATASESALKYFLLGSFATAFFLYGIALAFGCTGSTTIGALATGLGTTQTPVLAYIAVAMILVGLGFKVSAAPFHVWTPDVYQGAPAPVVGLMSTAPKAAAFAVLLRFLFNGAASMRSEWIHIIVILAALSAIVGNLGALLQKDVKRLLAYSSIAHAGYLLAGFTGIHQDAIASACFYTAAYAAMNVGAFLVLTQLTGYNEELRTIDDFTGIATRKPVLSAVFALFLLSLIGIPFTGGFFGKFYVFSSAIHLGQVHLAIFGLANSGIACFYYLRLMAAVYAKPVSEPQIQKATTAKPSFAAGLALAACAAATLVLGIVPNHLLNLLQRSIPATVVDIVPFSLPPVPLVSTPVTGKIH